MNKILVTAVMSIFCAQASMAKPIVCIHNNGIDEESRKKMKVRIDYELKDSYQSPETPKSISHFYDIPPRNVEQPYSINPVVNMSSIQWIDVLLVETMHNLLLLVFLLGILYVRHCSYLKASLTLICLKLNCLEE